MGLISEGRPLTWQEIAEVRSQLKSHALNDLIRILREHRHRHSDPFLWGDEVEFTLVRFDHSKKRVQLLLRADEILRQLREDKDPWVDCHAEDCDFVVEGVPSQPYSAQFDDFAQLEKNMQRRRDLVQTYLREDEFILNLSAFPRLGCPRCSFPSHRTDPLTSFEHSISCPDQFKSPNHPRTLFLNRNVNERRESKVSVNVPIYFDGRTSNPFDDDFSSFEIVNWKDFVADRLLNHIHLDSSSIGWGCSCLQVTFQGSSFEETLRLYDQFIPLTPIFLSLSVSCPIWRGYLSDVDSRWNVLSVTTDDRTREEKESNLLSTSRYSTVQTYLQQSSQPFNDLPFNLDEHVYQQLIQNDCPSVLAKHFSHLFLRDPLYVTDQQVEDKDPNKLYAFENHNSMVWNTLRLKPPLSASLGWRIEFRPMELQFTDFENASLAVFLSLLSRSLLTFGFDLRMPMSLVHENLNRAQRRNNLHSENTLHFPTQIFFSSFQDEEERKTREMNMDEIINGSGDFVGLIRLVEIYLDCFEDISLETRQRFNRSLQFISQRARGEVLTNAMWIRKFVINHPLYEQDSIVSEQIQYDLIQSIEKVANRHRTNSNDKEFNR